MRFTTVETTIFVYILNAVGSSSSSHEEPNHPPPSYSEATRGRTLDLRGKKKPEIHDILLKEEYPEEVTSINLTDCKLGELPPRMSAFTNLRKLYLGGNKLNDGATEMICNFEDLDELYLCNNPITRLPPDMFKLRKLHTLYLRYNKKLKDVNMISTLTGLRFLALRYCGISEVPEFIYSMKALVGLDLKRNKIANLSGGISNLANLSYLNIDDNPLPTLPDNVGKMLLITFIYDHEKTRLPRGTTEYTKLQILELTNDQLLKLKEKIERYYQNNNTLAPIE